MSREWKIEIAAWVIVTIAIGFVFWIFWSLKHGEGILR